MSSARLVRLSLPCVLPQLPFTVGSSHLAARHLSVPAPSGPISNLDPNVYHRVAGRTLEHIQECLEAYVDDSDDDSDVDFSGDVLNYEVDGRGTFVLNKQGPNKQIWLSSPLTGPMRFDLCLEAADWLRTRDHKPLGDILAADIEQLAGRPITFAVKDAVRTALEKG
eukprot:CAMPEP_0206052504 /NCGR_PEP_ID=MMETSP1466-20131121/33914_1 /ASSEMBLY_ACC=CAM_ASM_001126 /TAXON_ID=44452 /ORGANISM="Pavlova gyrans, Strain CCMP608" /LENGTH=166 /DNA_ID=CAMNT_0053427659 /DNA_START=1 /DNA_END=501 /DNA_ORIENTATION=+